VSRSLTAPLEEILFSVRLVGTYVGQLSKMQFNASVQVQDAVLRRIEIIGEGVKNLPADWKDAHQDIPWRQITRMRDILIHRYFSVDLDTVWQTATHDLPAIEPKRAQLLEEVRQAEAANASDDAPAISGEDL
jgi:uncharacterized protein with HEPN domain